MFRNQLCRIGLYILPVIVSTFALPSYAVEDKSSLTEKQISALETEIKQLKKEIKKNSTGQSRLKNSFKDYQDRLNITGFLSAGLSQSNRDRTYWDGSSNDLSTLARGKMGLQMGFKITPKAKAVLQILGKGSNEDWNLGAQWAYLSYDISSDYTFRAGRLRAPMFSQSEVIDVGYSYPWVRTPLEAYSSLPFNNFDGMDLTYRFSFGDAPAKLKFYIGDNALELSDGVKLDTNDLLGFDYSQTWQAWNLRIGYAKAHPYVVIPILSVDDEFSGSFGGVGLNYDDGNWLFMSEFTRREVDTYAISDVDGYYLTFGYYFGQWLPFVSVGEVQSKDDDKRANQIELIKTYFNQQQKTIGLGVRYDFSAGVAIKGEVWHAFALDDTNGLFADSGDDGIPSLTGYKNGTVFNIVIDAIF